MRWIDRGPEPGGVRDYEQRFTQGWVQYFRDSVGTRPEDSHWREFRGLLGDRSGDNCWYCERRCMRSAEDTGKSPTVDHFRPLNRFPELAYQWSNWVFSCRRCNEAYKGGQWPESGYVDPCAAEEGERPERYLDCDADTGEIVPIDGLSSEARARAQRTIDDLGLNQVDLRYYRLDWIRRFTADWQEFPVGERAAFAEFSTRVGVEFGGCTSMVVNRLGNRGAGGS